MLTFKWQKCENLRYLLFLKKTKAQIWLQVVCKPSHKHVYFVRSEFFKSFGHVASLVSKSHSWTTPYIWMSSPLIPLFRRYSCVFFDYCRCTKLHYCMPCTKLHRYDDIRLTYVQIHFYVAYNDCQSLHCTQIYSDEHQNTFLC